MSFAVVQPGSTEAMCLGICYNLEFLSAEVGLVELLADYFVHEITPGVGAVIEPAIDGFVAESTLEDRPSIRIRVR